MSTFKAIRKLLGVTQQEIARGIEMSQSNVAFIERGQTLTPDAARKLIAYAASLGVALSYDQIYGTAALPPPRVVEASNKAA